MKMFLQENCNVSLKGENFQFLKNQPVKIWLPWYVKFDEWGLGKVTKLGSFSLHVEKRLESVQTDPTPSEEG